MSIFDIPRDARLPRLGSVTDRDILDKMRRLERALATWQSEARGFRRTTTALQAAMDELYRVANVTQNYGGSIPPDEAEERALLCDTISRLDRHLAQFD
jgi:hypothetical protein